MLSFSIYFCCLVLCLHGCLVHSTLVQANIDRSRTKVLNVGEELTREVLPLRMGQFIYELHGLKELRWYEVKISYPASIPASFSVKLARDSSIKMVNQGRRLLNTEKLIFEADSNLPVKTGSHVIDMFLT
eukprot:Gb_30503 [translate_table: standard]